MTRDYGVLAVGWPGVKQITLAPEKPITCSYRLWIHRALGDADRIQQEFKAYSNSTAENTAPK
jgi:hypothetical protein